MSFMVTENGLKMTRMSKEIETDRKASRFPKTTHPASPLFDSNISVSLPRF